MIPQADVDSRRPRYGTSEGMRRQQTGGFAQQAPHAASEPWWTRRVGLVLIRSRGVSI